MVPQQGNFSKTEERIDSFYVVNYKQGGYSRSKNKTWSCVASLLIYFKFHHYTLHVRSYSNLSIARIPNLIYNIKAAWADRWLNTIEMECDVQWQYIFGMFLTHLVISI